MNATYETKDAVIANEIEPALGEHFDAAGAIDDIFEEAFELVCDTDENGTEHGNCYFVPRAGVDFWDVVEKHDPCNE